MNTGGLGGEKLRVAAAFAEIARLGPVPSTGKGDMAVGKTLLDLLGLQQNTGGKPTFYGMAITARRNSPKAAANRVNLFAMVPDWQLSACRSSAEIAERYGYDRDGGRRLYASVKSGHPNAQGLLLEVDRANGLLREKHLSDRAGSASDVAVWQLVSLRDRLLQRHPASVWVAANTTHRGGCEFFHYRFIRFTDRPRAHRLADLLDQGTVTMDHLILSKGGRTVEKGPLFKIHPNDVSALFPESPRLDLMSI